MKRIVTIGFGILVLAACLAAGFLLAKLNGGPTLQRRTSTENEGRSALERPEYTEGIRDCKRR